MDKSSEDIDCLDTDARLDQIFAEPVRADGLIPPQDEFHCSSFEYWRRFWRGIEQAVHAAALWTLVPLGGTRPAPWLGGALRSHGRGLAAIASRSFRCVIAIA